MSPLRERILCDPLFGIECFGCPNDHAQQDAKTNEYTEWPPRLHVFILSGVYESQYLAASRSRRGSSAAHRTYQIHSFKLRKWNASRVDSIFHSWHVSRVRYTSHEFLNRFLSPLQTAVDASAQDRWGCECYRAITSVTGPGKTESCRHDQAIIRIKYSPGNRHVWARSNARPEVANLSQIGDRPACGIS